MALPSIFKQAQGLKPGLILPLQVKRQFGKVTLPEINAVLREAFLRGARLQEAETATC